MKYVDSQGDFLFTGTWSSNGTYTATPLMAAQYGAAYYMCIRDNVGDNPQRVPTRSRPTNWSIMSLLYEYTAGTVVTAEEAYTLAESALNAANSAFNLAVYGTYLGTQAYDLAGAAYSIGTDAYALAQIGTNTGTAAYELAGSAHTLAGSAYDRADTALSTANGAFAVAVDAGTLANAAWALAQAGTNTGTVALEAAASAQSFADAAYQLAQIGTNTGTAAYELASAAYALAQIGTNTGNEAYALAQIGTNTGTAAYELAGSAYTLAGHKAASVVLCSAYTPAALGADAAEIPVPHGFDGSALLWNTTRFIIRVQTAGSAPAAAIEKSEGNGVFTAISLGTVTLDANAYEGTHIPASGSVASGDKLRFNVLSLGTAQNWTVAVELGI